MAIFNFAKRLCLFLPALFSTTWPVAAQQAGFAPEWEIRKTVGAVADQCQRLKPLLDQVNPKDWIAKGAPEAYVTQWNSTRAALENMKISAGNLTREPERLTFALDTFLRLDAFESMLNSLAEGVRKYQNPAIADLIRGVMSENSSNREKLRAYLLELAEAKEQEFRVVNQEAQRCRTSILRQPRQAAAPEKKAVQK
ncbi:MAG: hypothetical protein M1541_16280 [Acidobacteria bacterium]|nr:hypothetical protein [Acidobacteriota bacterium]